MTTDPDAFYPESTNPRSHHMLALKEICEFCPSKTPCGEWALYFEPEGFWGGMGVAERARIRRERGIIIDQSQRSAVA